MSLQAEQYEQRSHFMTLNYDMFINGVVSHNGTKHKQKTHKLIQHKKELVIHWFQPLTL